MHTDSCFLSCEMLYKLLIENKHIMEWITNGGICDHDEGFLCYHRARAFAQLIYKSQPTCNPGSLED